MFIEEDARDGHHDFWLYSPFQINVELFSSVVWHFVSRFAFHGGILRCNPTRCYSWGPSLTPALVARTTTFWGSEVRPRSELPSQARNFRRPGHRRAQVQVRKFVPRLSPCCDNSHGALVCIGSMKTCVEFQTRQRMLRPCLGCFGLLKDWPGITFLFLENRQKH